MRIVGACLVLAIVLGLSVSGEGNSYSWVQPDYCYAGVCKGSILILGNLTVWGEYVNITVQDVNVTGNITAEYIFASTAMGIGTTAPTAPLEIVGVGGTNAFKLTSGHAYFAAAAQLRIGDINNFIDGWSGRLNFYNGGNYNLVMNNGKVGIGTTSPSHKLNVVGDVNITHDLLVNNYINMSTDEPKIHMGDYGIIYESGDYTTLDNYWGIKFRDHLGETMRLKEGKVGIGTIAPSQQLEVAGNVSLNNTLHVQDGKVGIGITAPTSALSIFGGIGIDQDSAVPAVGNGDLYAWDGQVAVCDADTCDDDVATADGDLYVEDDIEVDGGLCIEGGSTCTAPLDGDLEVEDGSVCIGNGGCTPPAGDGNLAVEGTIRVDGTLTANSIILSTGQITANGGIKLLLLQINTPEQQIIPDDFIPLLSPTLNLAPLSKIVHIDCQDGDGCILTLNEGAGRTTGENLKIYSIGANAITFNEVAGVNEMAGNFVFGQYDSWAADYIVDRWIENTRSNN